MENKRVNNGDNGVGGSQAPSKKARLDDEKDGGVVSGTAVNTVDVMVDFIAISSSFRGKRNFPKSVSIRFCNSSGNHEFKIFYLNPANFLPADKDDLMVPMLQNISFFTDASGKRVSACSRKTGAAQLVKTYQS